jgi:hypothetical protein
MSCLLITGEIEWIHGEESHSVSWELLWLTSDGVIGIIQMSEVAPLLYSDHYRPSAMILAATGEQDERKYIQYEDEGDLCDRLTRTFVNPRGKWKGEVSRDINYRSSRHIIDRLIHSWQQRFGSSSFGMMTSNQLWEGSFSVMSDFCYSNMGDLYCDRPSLEKLFF